MSTLINLLPKERMKKNKKMNPILLRFQICTAFWGMSMACMLLSIVAIFSPEVASSHYKGK